MVNLKYILLITFLIFAISTESDAQQRTRGRRPYDNPSETTASLATTHMLPSAYVVPGGQLYLGTTIGYGFFDLFEISSNVYLDFMSVFNVSAKIGILKEEDFALGVHATYVTQPVKVNVTNASTGVTTTESKNYSSIEPGMTFSYRIFPSLVGHVGASFVSRNPTITKSDLNPKTGYVHGTTVNKEFTLGFSRTFALSVGGSYDITYDIPGVGVSIHIGNFQLGAHYYTNVSEGAVLPIIGGSYTANLD